MIQCSRRQAERRAPRVSLSRIRLPTTAFSVPAFSVQVAEWEVERSGCGVVRKDTRCVETHVGLS